ncbi:MAG: tRNA lysidine(34) synthetase TilS [Alphaproteobacteria bacterium]|nr:MAG: tRNA lysidine(34) synthetase TilS [Alphaproteobacteria bacterium]
MGLSLFSDHMLERLQGGRWLVGVSGGGDSVALLRLMIKTGLKDRMVVANFDHGWSRFGPESAEFVEKLCAKLDVPYVSGRGQTGKACANSEAVARDERYAWFESTVKAHGLDGVLVAHTRDDVVESFLIRAGKGSGLRGLAGMDAESHWHGMPLVRPLLDAGREGLRTYLRTMGQDWLDDPDNESGGSQRARVRKLMPQLEAIGIGAEGIAACVHALTDAEAALNAMVAQYEIKQAAKGGLELELAALQGVGVEIGVRVLARLMETLLPYTMVVRRSKRAALLVRLQSEGQGHATLGGLKFEWKQGVLQARLEQEA